jgi:chitinase
MSLQADIPYCRAKGVKIILSYGGDATLSNYQVPDNTTGTNLATFLYNAFGPYNSSWSGPRPFDSSPTDHTSVDGFDFDIEATMRETSFLFS